MPSLKKALTQVLDAIRSITPLCVNAHNNPHRTHECISAYSFIIDTFDDIYRVPSHKRIIDAMTRSRGLKTYGEFYQEGYHDAFPRAQTRTNMARFVFLENIIGELEIFYIPRSIEYIVSHSRKPRSTPSSRSRSSR